MSCELWFWTNVGKVNVSEIQNASLVQKRILCWHGLNSDSDEDYEVGIFIVSGFGLR